MKFLFFQQDIVSYFKCRNFRGEKLSRIFSISSALTFAMKQKEKFLEHKLSRMNNILQLLIYIFDVNFNH